MNYVRIAQEEARKRSNEPTGRSDCTENDMFLQKRRERVYRRLIEATRDFNGLVLVSGRRLLVENSGSVSVMPCIRFVEVTDYENHPLINVFIEITDDGEQSDVQCHAECLWLEQSLRLISRSADNIMMHLARQLGTILKVQQVFQDDE